MSDKKDPHTDAEDSHTSPETTTDESVAAENQQDTAAEKPYQQSAKYNDATPKEPSPARVQTPAKGSKLHGFFTTLNFLLLLGLIGAAVWVWMQWQQQEDSRQAYIETQQAKLDETKTLNEQTVAQLSRGNQSLQSQLSKLTESLDVAIRTQEDLEQQLADVSGRRPSDWLLAEADYLVRMAGRKLWLEHDIRTAILMLESADTRLRDMSDPSLIPIRERIAMDIQTLRQINPVSHSSIALAISGMVRQVDSLPLALPEIPSTDAQPEPVSDSVSEWRENLNKAWRFFTEELINYQPNSQPVRALLSEQQQWLVKEQLSLSLLQAQQAVLNRDVTLFEQSLQNALEMLVNHFDLEDASTAQFVSAVQNLYDTDIVQSYPERLSAAQPLQDLLRKRVVEVFRNEEMQL